MKTYQMPAAQQHRRKETPRNGDKYGTHLCAASKNEARHRRIYEENASNDISEGTAGVNEVRRSDSMSSVLDVISCISVPRLKSTAAHARM